MTDGERDVLARRLLGWGLACPLIFDFDIGRDLAFAAGPRGRDLALVSGVDNLSQGLSIAFTTVLGGDVFSVGFGFDGLTALVDETDPILQRERIRVAVIQVLRKDSRVRRILDVKLDDGQLERPRAGSRELDVEVAFETVAGETAAVNLGRMVTNG